MDGGGELRLSVRDVHKSFETASEPVVVLRGVSFELTAGEALAITGLRDRGLGAWHYFCSRWLASARYNSSKEALW
ncbi:MAG TPA: hypothetical protein VE078_07235 [Thermoanaerobaculia bacterium]|nr:hypothetical protein [Thermoanaerobaculia bacterium]